MTEQWILVLRAADAAAQWHVNQRRKGASAEPYINHLLEVALLVAEATNGKDADLIMAALLHDAIEDQKIPAENIASTFGKNVTAIVQEVTDDKSLEKLERKRLQIANANKKSKQAKILKMADKISNLRAIATSPPADWSLECRLEYIQWARDVAAGLKGISPMLDQMFESVAKAAECTVGKPAKP